VYTRSGRSVARHEGLSDPSLTRTLLVGGTATGLVGVNPLTGRVRWTVQDAFQALPIANGSGVFFRGTGARDPHANSVWRRARNGWIRRIVQFPPGKTMPNDVISYSTDLAGTTLAVTEGESDVFNYYDIFAVKVSTGAVTRVTSGGFSRYPSVSSEGRRIAYQRPRSCPGRVSIDELVVASGAKFEHKSVLLKGSCAMSLARPQWISPRTLVAQATTRRGKVLENAVVAVDVPTGRVTPLDRSTSVVLWGASPTDRTVAYSSISSSQGFTIARVRVHRRNGRVCVIARAEVPRGWSPVRLAGEGTIEANAA
jgi:hypothetical protein